MNSGSPSVTCTAIQGQFVLAAVTLRILGVDDYFTAFRGCRNLNLKVSISRHNRFATCYANSSSWFGPASNEIDVAAEQFCCEVGYWNLGAGSSSCNNELLRFAPIASLPARCCSSYSPKIRTWTKVAGAKFG